MDLSFSGAGFMGCYYFGVVDCWRKYIPRQRVNRVAGVSAGSLIAAYYLLDLPMATCLREIIELMEDIRRRPLGVFDRSNQMVDVLPKRLDRMFPEDAHKRVSGKLYVTITRLKDMKKITLNEFETRKDLIDALNCSCFIPVWSGNHVATYKGVKHIDGGFSDNLPVFDEHTIRICCFSGATDISPYDRAKLDLLSGTVLNTPLYFTLANFRRGRRALFPPPPSIIIEMVQRGFTDAKDFILSNDLIQCDTCYNKLNIEQHPIYSKISPTVSPRHTPCITPAHSYNNLNELNPLAALSLNKPPSRKNSNQKNDSSAAHNTNGHTSKRPKSGAQEDDAPHNKRSSSFSTLLREKLEKYSPASKSNGHSNGGDTETAQQHDINNNNDAARPMAPVIVVEDADRPVEEESVAALTVNTPAPAAVKKTRGRRASDSSLSAAATRGFPGSQSGDESDEEPVPPQPNQLAIRRATLAQIALDQEAGQGGLLGVKDKFTKVSNPLPSCPPSPNLNRHCQECLRMRQEARAEPISEEIRIESDKYRDTEPVKTGSAWNRITTPLRWIRQLGVRSSYKFEEEKKSINGVSVLTRHSRLHSGLKPYQCIECKQVSSRRNLHSTHERIHTGEKAYQCEHCACRRDMITRHMRTHTGGGACDRHGGDILSLGSLNELGH